MESVYPTDFTYYTDWTRSHFEGNVMSDNDYTLFGYSVDNLLEMGIVLSIHNKHSTTYKVADPSAIVKSRLNNKIKL
jgi:hypothetical protein